MSAATKARTSARGWATRASNKLETICTSTPVDKTELSDTVEEFDKRLAALDEVQSKVEIEIDEAKLDDDIEAACQLRENLRKSRIRATKLLADLLKPNSSDVGSGSRVSVDVKLPKLELSVFAGNVLEWQSIWDQFVAIVDESDLPAVNKFTYLKSLLQEEAKAAIQGLSVTSENYSIACDILKERFGRKE